LPTIVKKHKLVLAHNVAGRIFYSYFHHEDVQVHKIENDAKN